MIERLIEFFEGRRAGADPASRERALRLSAAVLMVELMRADFDSAPEERTRAQTLIQRCYGLDPRETAELIASAEAEADRAVSLHEFTRRLTDHLELGQREQLIELLWDLAYADGRIDKYEEYLLRRLADLLYVPHSAFIRAKHRAAARRSDA